VVAVLVRQQLLSDRAKIHRILDDIKILLRKKRKFFTSIVFLILFLAVTNPDSAKTVILSGRIATY
jgi:hypothetical protein